MTTQQAAEHLDQACADALRSFLSEPPAGTPPEVLNLLSLMAGDPGEPLPPRLYFEAVEQSPVAISITDAKADILYVNAAFEQLTGYSREEIKGQNESILSSNATPESLYTQLWRTIKDKRAWSGTLVNCTRDGEDYVAALTISPVLDRLGEIAYFLGMHRNITREHALRTELRQQKANIEAVLDAAPVLIVLLDAQGRVFLDNHEYKKLLGDLRGKEPLEVLANAIREQVGFDPIEAIRGGQGFTDVEISIEIPGSQGTRWYACSGTPTDEADTSARNYFARPGACAKSQMLLLASDITARRREIERAHLENLRARLAEQQMVHGMREALEAAIYQLQGPLNVIQAAIGMLKRGSAEPTTLASMLAQMSASGQQAMTTLKASLPEEVSEPQGVVNVNELLRQVMELETDRLLAAGIVVDWRPAPVLPRLTGHQNQLRSLFKHLIDNAINALNQTNQTCRELRLATLAVGDGIEVSIEDNGPGVPHDERFRVFEPFHIGWRNRRGHSGMGLAMSQEIVNQHGGCIDVDTNCTSGCRICLSLAGFEGD